MGSRYVATLLTTTDAGGRKLGPSIKNLDPGSSPGRQWSGPWIELKSDNTILSPWLKLGPSIKKAGSWIESRTTMEWALVQVQDDKEADPKTTMEKILGQTQKDNTLLSSL